MIRWGILGAGHLAAKWCEDLAHVPGSRLQAVWARDPGKAAAFAAAHGAARIAGSPEALVGGGDLDAVFVASPHGLHAAHARLALEAGLPVLVEKPFGLSHPEATTVADLAHARGLLCMEALWTRFLPGFRQALDVAGSGRIGAVRNVVADFGFVAPRTPGSRLWDPAQGGGSLLDIGIYPLFLARAFLGNPDRVSATMVMDECGVDARCEASLSWFDGGAAALRSSFVEATPGLAVVEGEAGRILFHSPFHAPVAITVLDASGAERIEPAPGGHGYEHEIAHFGECLREGRTESPWWSLSDTLDLALLLDRVREAAGG